MNQFVSPAKWWAVVSDQLPIEALANLKAYRMAMHASYIWRQFVQSAGALIERTSAHLAERLGVSKSTLRSYNKALGVFIQHAYTMCELVKGERFAVPFSAVGAPLRLERAAGRYWLQAEWYATNEVRRFPPGREVAARVMRGDYSDGTRPDMIYIIRQDSNRYAPPESNQGIWGHVKRVLKDGGDVAGKLSFMHLSGQLEQNKFTVIRPELSG